MLVEFVVQIQVKDNFVRMSQIVQMPFMPVSGQVVRFKNGLTLHRIETSTISVAGEYLGFRCDCELQVYSGSQKFEDVVKVYADNGWQVIGYNERASDGNEHSMGG